jgi:ubiquinone/menaquinone biosynthesis C-methylase UbiE
MNEPLIAAAEIAPGQRVLDLASGAGQPAFAISALLGASSEIVATDLLPEMLRGAQRRAAASALANLRFAIADMQALPFAAAAFDRATCRFGIMFVPDAGRALGEVRRVLRPGGRAAFMVWGARADTTMFRIVVGAAERILGRDPDEDMAAVFRFAAPGSLSALFAQAGFARIEERELRLEGAAPADAPFWRPQLEMSVGPRLERADQATRRALEAEVASGFAAEARDGRCRLLAHVRIVTGGA